MPRKFTLAAAALALGAATLSLGGSAQAATTPSVSVTSACQGGAGVITVGARRSPTGGTIGATVIRDVKRPNWSGFTIVGNSEPSGPPTESGMLHPVDGVVRDTTKSTLAWPKPVMGMYFSGDYSVFCVGRVDQNPYRVIGMGPSSQITVRRDSGVVRVEGEANRLGKYRLTVRLWTPAGFQEKSTVVNVGIDTNIGEFRHRFTGFQRTNKFTKAVLIAKNIRSGKTTTVTVRRTF